MVKTNAARGEADGIGNSSDKRINFTLRKQARWLYWKVGSSGS
jgi:hypothetical protein